MRDINKLSNNVMAQQLFLTLGATQRGAGTPEAAREVLRQWLPGRAGNAAAASVIANGSGLSRDGRLSARTLGKLLQSAFASPVMSELMSSLPVAGVDGTLRRYKGGPGRAHLKTGSLRDVVGIAGYVLGDSGQRYVVVAIVNHARADAARPALRRWWSGRPTTPAPRRIRTATEPPRRPRPPRRRALAQNGLLSARFAASWPSISWPPKERCRSSAQRKRCCRCRR